MRRHKAHMAKPQDIVLQLKSPDRPGIVARVSTLLAAEGCDIRGASVYGDPETGEFFVRMHILSAEKSSAALADLLRPLASELSMKARFFDLSNRLRVLVAVSKFDHCLNDLLHKERIGALPIDIVAVVSNHEDLGAVALARVKPFSHLPVRPGAKEAQEEEFLKRVDESKAELVVLARYMQILSNSLCERLNGRCINIHHSFLPSFKGAQPYAQAHARGVKLIGATAHYVTSDLDEGPIIEQDVRRVSHATTTAEMIDIGREVEASVLSRAVKWHAEHRVFLNGARTVILP